MSKKDLNHKVPSIALPNRTGKTNSFINRPVILGVLAFVIFALMFSLLIFQRYKLLQEAKTKEAYEIVNLVKDKLQESLTYSLSATKTLSFFIDNDGTVKNFDSIAAQILEAGIEIDALQLVPGGVIQYVYPLKGNETVIGYDILSDSSRNKEAYKAIAKREMFFAGPFELRQGGLGVVGRLPVYRNNKFWGFSAVVIRVSTLFRNAGIDSIGRNGYYFQLSKINPDTKTEEFFLPQRYDLSQSQSVSVIVPNGEWKLSVISTSSSLRAISDIGLLALLGFLLSVLGAVFVYRVAIRPKILNELVKERTNALKISENKYRSLIERVSDAFVSIDKDWNYTYVNNKAGEIFSRDPESLTGKNIWVEFPEAKDMPFYHAYYRAMETQEYQYIEEYFEKSGKWFENHIYPSANGLTIFFKDVTEIKKISLALKENEEKYRSLIEQASDGIVISDLDGNILEVNRSIAVMNGYSIEEMEGEHLYRFLPEEDATLNPLRLKELMEGKSLLFERRLLKKDGTILDIEVNCKMASSQTIISFIRDITERKRNEDILRYQARLLESVSDAITSLDMNRCIVSWNQSCEDLYGFTIEEVMGKKIPELVTFEFPGTIQEEVFNQVFSEGKWKGEFNFIHPKTKIKTHLLSSINLLRNMKGEISGFIITSKDISDLKQAADKLEKREAQLSASIENTPNIAVQWYNDKGEILYWNHASELMYGWTSDEAAGKTLDQLIHTPEEAAEFLKILEQVARTGSTIGPSEYEFRRRDGTKGFCIATIFSIPADEGDLCFVCMDVDITERKKAEAAVKLSEEKYRTLIDQASDGIFIADKEGHFEMVNFRGSSMSQYTPEEIMEMSIYDFVLPTDIEKNPFHFDDMSNSHAARTERKIKRKDGTFLDVEITAKFISGNRFLAFVRDISDRKRAEGLLQKSYDDIRQLASSLQSIREDERTNIAREIHDELGQQLTGLKMDLHWLARKINSTDKEINDKMKESIELINTTITSVRKISTNLRPSILDDLGLLPALEWHGEEFQKRSGTRVEFINKAGDITVQPEATTAIFRIYQELLTNIARHANASLVTAVLFKDNSRLYFSITDNGVGFNLETINNKKTLGLLGIKERTLLLGGTYEFKSNPGEGSVTTISVPLNMVKRTI